MIRNGLDGKVRRFAVARDGGVLPVNERGRRRVVSTLRGRACIERRERLPARHAFSRTAPRGGNTMPHLQLFIRAPAEPNHSHHASTSTSSSSLFSNDEVPPNRDGKAIRERVTLLLITQAAPARAFANSPRNPSGDLARGASAVHFVSHQGKIPNGQAEPRDFTACASGLCASLRSEHFQTNRMTQQSNTRVGESH